MIKTIVPYRDSAGQLEHHATTLYELSSTTLQDSFEIQVIEQNDQGQFNKGGLFNDGCPQFDSCHFNQCQSIFEKVF